ncbi:hypothetical protein [Leifsonia poae]|uniref:hypothetical protein n=1 Tax=Leifsonia poae TaxID=110933 RepID=UPI001CBCFFBA|nr:hypothetical protein [Leifsonia poae]
MLVFFLGLIGLAASTDVLGLTLSWLVVQIASNAVTAALIASFADNVPQVLRGRASSVIALAQNLTILALLGALVIIPIKRVR